MGGTAFALPVFAIKLTYAFITKAFVNNEQLCVTARSLNPSSHGGLKCHC